MNWQEDLAMQKPPHRRRLPLLVPPTPTKDPDDTFAPFNGVAHCIDANGYKRRGHEYIVEARDGNRCCWCNRLNRMEPL